MDIKELISNFRKQQRVKKYEEVILTIEKLAGLSKLPLANLYLGVYGRTKDEVYLDIANRLNKGESKMEIYKDFLSSEIYLILKESEKRNLPIYKVIENLDNARDVINKVRGKIYSTLNFGLGYFLFISVAVYFLLKGLVNKLGNIDLVKDKSIINGTVNIYPFVILFVFLILILSFYVYKYKTPVLKKVFIDIELSIVLILTKLLYTANLPIKSIIEYFANSKSYFSRGFSKIINENKEEALIKEYIFTISDALSPEEASILESSFKAGRFKEVLLIVADKRMEKIKQKAESYSKIILYFAIGLSIIPIGMLLVAYINLIMQIVHNAIQMMNNY